MAKRRRRAKSRFERRLSAFVKSTAAVLIIAAAGFAAQKSGITESVDSKKTQKGTASDPTASVTFVDVGQGDATLIESDGSFMLIDTGDRDSDNTLINYMQEQGVEKLDYLILTHPHADHIGEAAEVVEAFDIGKIIVPDVPDDLVPTTSVYENLLDAMDDKGLKFRAARDETFDFGDCTVSTYAAEGEYSNANNYSVLVKITHGDNDFLITGDCEVQEEQEFLSRDIELSADVLKAAHHGSDTSSSEKWLKAVAPQYTVISCGADNKYGHPDSETYSRLCEYSEDVYRTDEDGTVIFESDGKGISVSTSG